jgi:hypothetical protein
MSGNYVDTSTGLYFFFNFIFVFFGVAKVFEQCLPSIIYVFHFFPCWRSCPDKIFQWIFLSRILILA